MPPRYIQSSLQGIHTIDLYTYNAYTCFSYTQAQIVVHLERLHSFLLQGESECHVFEAAPACSGGKVFKNCHHQVSLHVHA